MTFLRRLFAFLLAGMFFAVALFVILQLRPASGAGWAVWVFFLLLAACATLFIYRRLMGSDFGEPYPFAGTGEGYAPGIMAGAGGSRRRKREEDEDADVGTARGQGAAEAGEVDDPAGLT